MYLNEFDPHLTHSELRLVALVQNLLVFDLKLDILVVSHAAADAVEYVEVGCYCQVTVQHHVEYLKGERTNLLLD